MAKPATKEILNELTRKIEKIVEDHDTADPILIKNPRKCKYYLYLKCLVLINIFLYLYYLYLGLSTVKKKIPISIANESSENEIEPLKLVTKQSGRCHSKVKRKLIEKNSEGGENDEELAHIKANEDSETDYSDINIIKRAKRQNE